MRYYRYKDMTNVRVKGPDLGDNVVVKDIWYTDKPFADLSMLVEINGELYGNMSELFEVECDNRFKTVWHNGHLVGTMKEMEDW